MFIVLAIVYMITTKTDVTLKTKVRNQCWTVPEHPNNTKSLLTTEKAYYKLFLEKPFLFWHKVYFGNLFVNTPFFLV